MRGKILIVLMLGLLLFLERHSIPIVNGDNPLTMRWERPWMRVPPGAEVKWQTVQLRDGTVDTVGSWSLWNTSYIEVLYGDKEVYGGGKWRL